MPKRCSFAGCCVKLGLSTTFLCRCGLEVCMRHRLPEDHLCKFNYKLMGTQELEKQLVKVIAEKISGI